jgi:D-alanine-D-alanine ligase
MKLKIGFTYDSKEEYSLSGEDLPDRYAEFDSKSTIEEISLALKSHGDEVICIGNARNLVKRITAGERWDIVFNICEGLKYRNREAQVPAILELYDIPYAGSDPLTMSVTLDKTVCKKIIEFHGINTPAFRCIDAPGAMKENSGWIEKHLPVIVKPSHEGTSKGLSQNSLCRSFDEAAKQAGWVLENYRQPALIEQFIKGYEFTVAVIGNDVPRVFPPVQVVIKDKKDLGEDFYTFQRASTSDTDIRYVCPAQIDAKLDKTLRCMALDAYKALECRDFSRMDFRVDYKNNPYFLECNPLPQLGLIDVFPLVAEAEKMEYREIVFMILQAALDRLNRSR